MRSARAVFGFRIGSWAAAALLLLAGASLNAGGRDPGWIALAGVAGLLAVSAGVFYREWRGSVPAAAIAFLVAVGIAQFNPRQGDLVPQLAGLVLLARPMQGVLTLTIVVGAYFLAEGVATIMYALEHRRELSERWSWLLVSGLMDILIAFLIIAGLPGSAEWAIGLLVGINLVLGGASLVGMALAARNS